MYIPYLQGLGALGGNIVLFIQIEFTFFCILILT